MSIDFRDQIKLLGDRVNKLKEQVNTEEATKNAFVMPFIKELGYDVFNPLEVIPEFVADVGIKQGEKIDYAILKEQDPVLLIECKWHGQSLTINNASQLFRYFHTTKAKFAILTNGIEYKFYTDLVEANKMDEKPFFVFDITQIKDNQVEELKKFHKSYFDFENIVNTASELKYTNELKKLINTEINSPSTEFVRHFARQIYSGSVTQRIVEQFSDLIKKSFTQQINDLVTDRLKSALTKESESQKKIEEEKLLNAEIAETKIVTTQEELDTFYIVRAILCMRIKPGRIVYRDAQSYFAILLDDNNRKTICRLYLSERRKQIGIFDAEKKETKFELETIESIYEHADKLIKIVHFYDQ
ncbi:type I restriction endonuclease [Gynurincola endophyticus]|uniref:type I restriction endonuclease n=1 Tax=Gynurincola endophyticus TaxID=2479004 RepID=UPI001F45FEB7|nr:type I restriction endonuclease [Gynurincola endophyticus]